jgi:hypothetical protein
MGKKNNSYTASYKLKVISFAEQFGNRAVEREFGIGIQRALLEETKRRSRPPHKKSAYFPHPDFSAAKLGKKVCKLC